MRFANQYGHWELQPFPGSNQVVVSTHVFIEEEFRGNGHGKAQHRERLEKIEELGYDYVLCTVVADNTVQKAILANEGWRYLDSFENRVTGNTVLIYGRAVNRQGGTV